MLDPTPSFVQDAVLYVHIRYAAFVALDIFGGAFMGFFHKIRLYIECFNLAGIDGLKACHKYLSGVLSLPNLPSESSFSRLVVLMRRFLHSWFFRCIAYFCLICCIFVNCSPIRAQAVILETILAGAGIVTGSILRGLGMGQDFTQQVLTRIF